MDIQTVAGIGEAVGGGAVLLTLLYLSFQLRLANRIAAAVAQQNVFSQAGSIHRAAMVQDVAQLRVKLRTATYDELDTVERELAETYTYELFNLWASVQTAFNQGLASQAMLEIYIQDIANELARFPVLEKPFLDMWRKYPVIQDWPIWQAIVQVERESRRDVSGAPFA